MKVRMPSVQNRLPTFAQACADYNGASRKVNLMDPNMKIVEVLVTIEEGDFFPGHGFASLGDDIVKILGEELRLGRLLKQAAFGNPDADVEFVKLREPDGPRTAFVATYVNPMELMYMLSGPSGKYAASYRSFYVYTFMRKREPNQAKTKGARQ